MTLELRSVRKRLGSFVLPELDLTVEDGEYFVLLGPSGVGKTVLLEMIAGLLIPDAGEIHWGGRDITRYPPERRGFAIVYQDYALFPHMTVMQNIVYGLRSRGLPRAKAEQRAEALAEQLNILSLLDRKPRTLSGGEQQRVALARALVVAPPLLLLDEPLSAVDVPTRRHLQGELKRIQQQVGATFIHVTHDVLEAVALGHRVGVMHGGRLHQVGTPEELVRRPSNREVAAFLGMRNIFAGSPCPDGYCSVQGVKIHVGERADQYRHIWIRPEEILLSGAAFESSARNQFRCVVEGWEFRQVLVEVQLRLGELRLSALITYASFEELTVGQGTQLYATFKSSSVHCF